MRNESFESLHISYELDSDDRITDVGRAWDHQALLADAPNLLGEQVRGTFLRDHIQDHRTWLTTKGLLDRARNHFMPLALTYRCDTPDRKREFVMVVGGIGQNAVKVSHHMLSDVECGPIVSFETAVSRGKVVDRCSICNRLNFDDKWVDPFTLGEDIRAVPRYVVCDECEQIALKA